ncbi:AraC family transcriptional regulator [Shewanella corallii]|uniref:AraC family transcriptional regulator n=1 Tax=Shewanella corallii TaxID=560080 RepID=A0ABT0NDL3_9GAMM|nr:AraC family transcriptional regulator [Shewanella corallii]MCL2915916.1 AraC family transcriptional regulator [Shewanella corallii]
MEESLITVPADTVCSFVNFIRQHGLEPENEIDMYAMEALCPGQTIDVEIYERLISFAQQRLNRPQLGFEFGQCVDAGQWGILGYIAYTSSTIKDALENQMKFQSLAGTCGLPEHEYGEQFTLLKWVPAYHCSHHVVEAVVTSWVAMARRLTAKNIPLRRVCFQHSAMGSQQSYEDYFQCEVSFCSDFNGVDVCNSAFGLPLNQHNPIVHDSLIRKAENIMDRFVTSCSLDAIVGFIQEQLPYGVPEIESTAAKFSMSVRTLQRRLDDYQLTYREIVDQVRRKNAIRYLENADVEILQVAQLLGFAEQSSFQRAFKRWTDKTPNAFRQSLLTTSH